MTDLANRPYEASIIGVKNLLTRIIVNHWKLWTAAAIGGGVYGLLPSDWSTMSRTLTGWDAAVTLLLILTFTLLPRLSSQQLQEQYKEDDPSAPIILAVVVVASIASVAAIVAFVSTLKQVPESQKAAHILLAAYTIIGSWVLIPTVFALHYADLFYSAPPKKRPLSFPDTDQPSFWDFAYFSFTIAAACQTADVSTSGIQLRKNVIAHSVISVLFNVSILGFAVNITAGLLA